ncbi:MAG: DPP IV N-terminal domain-containing protein [Limisphaerales bacterium]
MNKTTSISSQALTALLLVLPGINAHSQDRLKAMPGYEQFAKTSRAATNVFTSGAVAVTWKEGGKAVEFAHGGKRYRHDLVNGERTELPAPTAPPTPAPAKGIASKAQKRAGPENPVRGRQFTYAISPDGKQKAFYRDRNLWLGDTNGANAFAITTDGSAQNRIKSGTASWVYGEELFQKTAMWWSGDSRKVAFYRFDESQVPDFHLQLGQTKILSTADVEPYVKAGGTNPVVDLLIYDLASNRTVRVDVRDGRPFDNSVIGHYVYGVSWTSDGKELLFHRTNRRQNVLEFCAANPETGKCRVIVREEWPASWTENSPTLRWLKDSKRFIWASDRTGWRNYYLYDLSGKLLTTLTSHAYEVAGITRVDEDAGLLHYLARSGDNPMKVQLHRVGLDGRGEMRLTEPAFHHTVDFAPDGKHFVDIEQTHNQPPTSWLCNADGKIVTLLAKSDLTRANQLGLKPSELLRFKAADGTTDLFGLLHFPSNFRASQKYPLLVSVYAGPETVGARETFTLAHPLTEFGFLVATFDSRSASGRGKHFLDAIYQKLGIVEVDDQAAGVKSLWARPYVNRSRVGIFGTSYGGTVSATALLRHPDVFHAACSSSAVTDYRNYDSIYAERYMWIPQEAKAAFDAASIMTYAANLKGRLMLFYGTADDNVHPNNTMQLVAALQRAGKSFEVQVGPDIGHASINRDRMMEFFIENLVMR